MTPRPVAGFRPRWVGFADWLGERWVAPDAGGGLVELLRVSPAIGTGVAFAEALQSAHARLAAFSHPGFVPIRHVDGPDGDGVVTVVSDHVAGARLSQLIEQRPQDATPLPTGAVLYLLHTVASALADLHRQWRGSFHGTLTPDRILLAADGRVLLTEHIFGIAFSRREPYSRADLWPELGLAVPAIEGIPPFAPLADHLQVGVLALSLLLGRPLGPDDYPERLPDLLGGACETDLVGEPSPLGAALRDWLARALLVASDGPYPTLPALASGLEALIGDEGGYVAVPVGLEIEPPPLEPVDDPAAARTAPSSDLVASDGDWRFARGNTLDDDEAPCADPGDDPAVVRYEAVCGYDPQQFEVATTVAGADASPATACAAPPEPAPLVPPEAPRAPEAPPPVVESFGVAAVPVRPSSTPRPPAAVPNEEAPPPPIDPRPERGIATGVGGPAWPRSPWRRSRAAPYLSAPARRLTPARVAAAAVVLLLAGVGALWSFGVGSAPTGWLKIDSHPSGAEIVVAGQVRGRTPAVVELPAGSHLVELRGMGSSVLASIDVRSGEQTTEVVALRDARPAGALSVDTIPSGADVHIDGVLVGTSPLSVDDLRPGYHMVLVRNASASIEQRVDIEPAQTVELSVPLSGWIVVTAPLEIEVFDRDQRIGSSRDRRIGVPAGRRRLVFVNETVAFRLETEIDIEAGRSTKVPVSLPTGWLSVGSDVTADVRVDGRPVGSTPVASLEVSLGMHEVTVSHPRLGDQTFTVLVALGSPTRVNAVFSSGPVRARTGTPRRAR